MSWLRLFSNPNVDGEDQPSGALHTSLRRFPRRNHHGNTVVLPVGICERFYFLLLGQSVEASGVGCPVSIGPLLSMLGNSGE